MVNNKMINTPIADFVKTYAEKNMSRLHMPGHKGQSFLGCESYDITEVSGADALYEAEGIIAESELNATELFGTARTVYSTEGSSQCIRAMLYLAVHEWKKKNHTGTRPVVVAARNVHKTFVYAAALLDFDIIWLWPEESYSICGCPVSVEQLVRVLRELRVRDMIPAAVYVTSPDYLGGIQDISAFAQICHEYDTILAVDNAHGAYLHFTEMKQHPIDLGADICCDSAHKTLPVLTGGAYLHINKNTPESFVANVKGAMALFGSTSPSYLILSSLDMCNRYLSDGYEQRLSIAQKRVHTLRMHLKKNGWQCEGAEPLKVTIRMSSTITGSAMADVLRKHQIECEYADAESIVLMFTPENREDDYTKVEIAFGENRETEQKNCGSKCNVTACKAVMTIRDALFAEHEEIPVTEARGRVCAAPTVSCPPAIPIVVSGEVIGEDAIEVFLHYGIRTVDVVK